MSLDNVRTARRTLLLASALAMLGLSSPSAAETSQEFQFHFGDSVQATDREAIQQILASAANLTRLELQENAPTVAVFAYETGEEVADAYHQNEGNSERSAEVDERWTTWGYAESTPNGIYVRLAPAWHTTDDRAHRGMLFHEYVHALQWALSGPAAPRESSDEVPSTGPYWFTEGAAEHLQAVLQDVGGYTCYPDSREPVAARAQGSSAVLADLETYQGFQQAGTGAAYAISFLATEFFAADHGGGALLDVSRHVGEGLTFPEAFESVARESIEAFSDRFQAHRESGYPPQYDASAGGCDDKASSGHPAAQMPEPDFVYSPSVLPEFKTLVEDATRKAIRGFEARFGIVETELTVHVTGNDEEWRAIKADGQKIAQASHRTIWIPTDAPEWFSDAAGSVERNRYGQVLHEYAHVLQFLNQRNDDAADEGSAWHLEGGAEVARALVEHDQGLVCYEQSRSGYEQAAARGPRLDEMTSYAGLKGHPDGQMTAQLGVDFLMARHGQWAALAPGNFSAWADLEEVAAAFQAERDAGFPYLGATTIAPCATPGSPNVSPDAPTTDPVGTGGNGIEDAGAIGISSPAAVPPHPDSRGTPLSPLIAVLAIGFAVTSRRHRSRPIGAPGGPPTDGQSESVRADEGRHRPE